MNGTSGTATTTANGFPSWCIADGSHHPLNLLERSKDLYLLYMNGNVYNGQTYADQTQEELDGIARLATRGRSGDATITKVVVGAKAILDNDFLDGSSSDFTYILDLTTQNATNMYGSQIIPNLRGKLYHVGDSSADNLADELDDTTESDDMLSAHMYAKNYNAERDIQDSVITVGVELGRQAIIDADALRMAGLYQREYDQAGLEDVYKQWYDGEVSKVRYLEVLGNAIRGLIGTQVSTTRPYYRPGMFSGMMGGAMSGAGVGMMTGNPWGIAAGVAGGMAMGAMSSQ